MVWLVALWLIIMWFRSNNTNAADYTITLNLNSGGTSTCTRANYSYTTGAAISQVTVTQDNNLSCNLYASTLENVYLKSTDLTQSSSVKIWSWNVKLTSSWTSLSAWFETSYHQTVTDKALSTQQKVFAKPANKIWTFEQKETIKITIPAGSPSGTYTGTLTVSITAS